MDGDSTPNPPAMPAEPPALQPDRLADLPDGWRVDYFTQLPSTNARCSELARDGAGQGTVVVTDHQVAGRGRLDRGWETPARVALTFSVLLRPAVPLESWTWLPLLTGYAVQSALADRLPEVGLKWPNDVLIPDSRGEVGVERKICGILLERVETPQGPAAVLGIGLNVNQSLAQLPPTGTSMRVELGESFDRTDLLRHVLLALHALLPLIEEPEVIRAVYSDGCATLGRQVTALLPGDRRVSGEAIGIGEGGALVLATADGTEVISAGDVVHLRPA